MTVDHPERATPAGRRPWLWPLVAVAAVVVASALAVTLWHWRSGPATNAERFAYGPAGAGDLPVLFDAPEFELGDQHGATVTRATLAGHVWVADFIFTTCTSVCPMLSAKMRLLQRKLVDPNVRFVSFSVDPEHDTTAALLAYQKLWSPDERRWLLLHTEPDSLASVSRGMRVSVTPSGDAENPILHTSLFFLVDPKGHVRGVYDSDDDAALKRLAADAERLSPAPQAAAAAPAEASGRALFAALGCGGCHDNPKLAPALAGIWGRSTPLDKGGSATVDASYVRESILAPARKLVHGYLNLMPSYEGEISERGLDALVSYVQSLTPPAAAGASAAVASSAPSHAGTVPAMGAMLAADTGPGTATDPVCGMPVRAAADGPHADYEGKTYYFCSDDCREKFTKNPRAYLK